MTKRNPQDATRRNVQSANKKLALCRLQVADHEKRIEKLEHSVSRLLFWLSLVQIVPNAKRTPKRSKRK